MNTTTIVSKNKKGEIKIPKEMDIDDDKVYLKKVGNVLYVIPYHSPWQNLIDSTGDFMPDFMAERNQREKE